MSVESQAIRELITANVIQGYPGDTAVDGYYHGLKTALLAVEAVERTRSNAGGNVRQNLDYFP